MEKKYRVAVVGCGDIAETGHVPALLKHDRFELAALCDLRFERAQQLAKLTSGVAVSGDYRNLLDYPNIDAVILALHPQVSVDIAIQFLQHGKPVLDEKPLAANLADGKRLARAVAETKCVYQIGFVLRYSEVVECTAELAPRLGTPALYHVTVFDELLNRNNTLHFERIQSILKHSSAITHEGSHVMDYFHLWNTSGFTSTSTRALKTCPDFNGPNVWSAQLGVADGSILELEIGWFLPALPASTVSISGPNGFSTIDFCTGNGYCNFGGEDEPIAVAPHRQNWQRQLDLFAGAIDNGQAIVSTVEDGLRALAATMACEESYRSGRTVSF